MNPVIPSDGMERQDTLFPEKEVYFGGGYVWKKEESDREVSV